MVECLQSHQPLANCTSEDAGTNTLAICVNTKLYIYIAIASYYNQKLIATVIAVRTMIILTPLE